MPVKKDGRRSSVKSPGATSASPLQGTGLSHSNTELTANVNASRTNVAISHSRESVGGIIVALAIVGAFYGLHAVAAFLFAHPLTFAALAGSGVAVGILKRRRP